MTQKVKPIPEGRHTVTPYIVVAGAVEAIEFYEKAFGAKVISRNNTPDGKVMHAELKIGDSLIMLSDEFPNSSCNMSAPTTLKGSTVMLHLYVEDVDSVFDKAIKAGAKEQMAVSDTFWGDRYGQIVDPFGHLWSVATRKEILTDEEVAERAGKFFAEKQ